MSFRSALVSTVLTLFALCPATLAYAQQKSDGPCAADAKKFCSGVRPGDGRIHACMMGHRGELSPACQERMKQASDKLQSLAKACKADAEKYCKGVRPGEGRILSCLKGRQSDLAPACAAEFKRTGNDPALAR